MDFLLAVSAAVNIFAQAVVFSVLAIAILFWIIMTVVILRGEAEFQEKKRAGEAEKYRNAK